MLMFSKFKFLISIFILVFIISFMSFNVHSESKTEEGGNPVVLIKTNKGNIKVELYREKAPISVDNFLSYVNDGFYTDTIFHRVIKGFMIQAGGLTEDFKQKVTKAPIKNEANNGLKNVRGSVAMARTAAVDSATSQFFINEVDNESLDQGKNGFGYAVFGQVTEGMDVVDKISNVPTGNKIINNQFVAQDVPIENVVIISIELIN